MHETIYSFGWDSQQNNQVIEQEYTGTDDPTLVIQANSSGFSGENSASIKINECTVKMEKNEVGNYRGLHFVLVNPSNGNVEFAKVFDTYTSSDAFENFI